jgi:outer membrane protein OmpA-like peptidoglycan-associated protein
MTGRRIAVLAVVALAAMMASACGPQRVATQPQPQTLVVALAEPDGTEAGRVIVTNATGAVELRGTGESTRVLASAAPSPAAVMDAAAIAQVFGATVGGLPQPLEQFNLYFQVDSDDLTEESRALLPEIVRAVAARVAADVTVIGHTDTTGAADANAELGLKRATAVRALLVAAGLDPSVVETASHGEADLLVRTPDNTPEPRNRRVEITVK